MNNNVNNNELPLNNNNLLPKEKIPIFDATMAQDILREGGVLEYANWNKCSNKCTWSMSIKNCSNILMGILDER